jgi:hypothetical protein
VGFGAIESDVGEGGSGVREAFSREIEEMLWFAWAHNLSFSTLQAEWSERLVRLCKDNELENSGKTTNLLSRQSGVNAWRERRRGAKSAQKREI